MTGRPTGAIGTARIVWTAVVVCLSLARRMHGQCLRIVGAEKDQAGGWGSWWSRNIAWKSTRCRPGSFGETDHQTQLGRLGGRFFVLNRNTSKGNNMANEEFARDQYRAGARLAGHPAAGIPLRIGAMTDYPRLCAGRHTMVAFESAYKFGWLQGLRKLLKEKKLWLRRPDTYRIHNS